MSESRKKYFKEYYEKRKEKLKADSKKWRDSKKDDPEYRRKGMLRAINWREKKRLEKIYGRSL